MKIGKIKKLRCKTGLRDAVDGARAEVWDPGRNFGLLESLETFK